MLLSDADEKRFSLSLDDSASRLGDRHLASEIVTSKSLEIIEMVTQKKAVAWGFAVKTTKNQKG